MQTSLAFNNFGLKTTKSGKQGLRKLICSWLKNRYERTNNKEGKNNTFKTKYETQVPGVQSAAEKKGGGLEF